MALIAITTAHSGKAVPVAELDRRFNVPCAAVRDDGKPCASRASYVTLDSKAPVCGQHTEPGRGVAFPAAKRAAG